MGYDLFHMSPGDSPVIRALREKLANESIGIFIDPSFPWWIRMGKIEGWVRIQYLHRRCEGMSWHLVRRAWLLAVWPWGGRFNRQFSLRHSQRLVWHKIERWFSLSALYYRSIRPQSLSIIRRLRFLNYWKCCVVPIYEAKPTSLSLPPGLRNFNNWCSTVSWSDQKAWTMNFRWCDRIGLNAPVSAWRLHAEIPIKEIGDL